MKLQDEVAQSKTSVNKKPSIKQEIIHFCSYTTAHGLGRLAESRGFFHRTAWSVFCIGALIMFVIQMYNLFLIYLSRPVATVVNVHHESVSMTIIYIDSMKITAQLRRHPSKKPTLLKKVPDVSEVLYVLQDLIVRLCLKGYHSVNVFSVKNGVKKVIRAHGKHRNNLLGDWGKKN